MESVNNVVSNFNRIVSHSRYLFEIFKHNYFMSKDFTDNFIEEFFHLFGVKDIIILIGIMTCIIPEHTYDPNVIGPVLLQLLNAATEITKHTINAVGIIFWQ